MSLLNIGLKGLSAAQGELSTTSHNIANVNTPGYSRQEAVLSTAVPQYSGSGFLGRGVDVSTVRRQYDQFLTGAVQTGTARSAADSTRSDLMSQVNKIFGDSNQGIGAALDGIFSAASDLASQPGDLSARQVFVSRNAQFAQKLVAVGQQLDQLQQTTDRQITQSLADVNQQLTQIYRLNAQIASFQSTGQPPNDLLDQRDQALLALNQLMAVNVVGANDGSINLFASNGAPLLVGSQQSQVVATPDAADPARVAIQLKLGAGTPLSLPGDSLGGRLGGLFQFRDGDLDTTINQLGRIAVVTAERVNTQQALGIDASGASGKPLYAVPSPTVVPNVGNTGSAGMTVSVVDANLLEASNYRVDYDGSSYTITRLSDGGITNTPVFPATVDGLKFDAVGTPAAGNSYLVKPYTAASTGLSAKALTARDVATALPATAEADAANHGTGSITDFQSVRRTTDSALPVTITFNDPPTTFNVTGLAGGDLTNVSYAAGQRIPLGNADYNGWSITLDGAMAAGDRFSVTQTRDPANSNGNARAFAALADQSTTDGATLNETYAALIGDVGSRAQGSKDSATVSGNLLNEAQSRQQNVGGVNLDEEAANLLRYQQAYQASAKVIQASQQIFDTLLSAVAA